MDINSSGNFVQQSAAGAACVGVLQNNPGSGHEATVAIAGESKVVAGATLSPGNRVQSNASGQAIAAASGDMAQGIVKQGASSGNLATIVLQPNSGQVN
ncbi:MAG: DUF2190 family protein [Nitrosopumilaceae archaeon]|nr:DUF2190 family protein [Nitrosopumilaceae archaeon]NIV64994.1 DUF2190 family protein [Nitrosopumilaceae archaeon]NIX60478.1 DUF2190 family protein [Nitrosopumilaceae archaeon]